METENLFDFPKIQICTNINKQHLNFLKKKTLDEVIKEEVGSLSNFLNIYIGKQSPNVLRKIKQLLIIIKVKLYIQTLGNYKKINFFIKIETLKIKLNTKNVYSKGMFENVCLAIKIALDLDIDKHIIIKTIPG